MLRLSIVFTVALVSGAGTAQAGWRVERAQQIAAIAWNHPCGDHIAVTFGPTVTVDVPQALGPPILANASAQASVDECAITLSSARHWSWMSTCYVILHETGHIAGFRDPANAVDPLHSHNPASVMWAWGSDEWDRRCDGRGRRFLATAVSRPG